MSEISAKGGAWSFANRASTVFGSSRFVTASNRVKPRAADSSNCRTLRLTAGSRISFGWLTRPHSRRMLRYNGVPTVFSNPAMRTSRSSPCVPFVPPLLLPALLWPLPEVFGVLLPFAWLRPFAPFEGVPEPLSPFLLEGRIPLRQFSGSAQANNAGVLSG